MFDPRQPVHSVTPKRKPMRKKSLEKKPPEIGFRDSAKGRVAVVPGHRLAVWEVVDVHEQTKSITKTARHLRWSVSLVRSVLAYAAGHRTEIEQQRSAEFA